MQPIKVLIVEDEVIVARDIRDTLSTLGYEVCAQVSAGEEAITKSEELKPDVVLMDIMLQGDVDGIQAAETIRSRMNIPVIFLTAFSNENTIERAKTAKPYGYILKPFQDTDLYTAIEIAVHKHRLERKLIEETENAIATVIGSTEVLMEEGSSNHTPQTLQKIEAIRRAALIIKETIEKI